MQKHTDDQDTNQNNQPQPEQLTEAQMQVMGVALEREYNWLRTKQLAIEVKNLKLRSLLSAIEDLGAHARYDDLCESMRVDIGNIVESIIKIPV